MSEIPLFGRNVPYMTSFALFVILAIPTALVDNYAGLLVLRFLTGFMGSPCLATGGATMQDLVHHYSPSLVSPSTDFFTVRFAQAAVCSDRMGRRGIQCTCSWSFAVWICCHRKRLALGLLGDLMDVRPGLDSLVGSSPYKQVSGVDNRVGFLRCLKPPQTTFF